MESAREPKTDESFLLQSRSEEALYDPISKHDLNFIGHLLLACVGVDFVHRDPSILGISLIRIHKLQVPEYECAARN